MQVSVSLVGVNPVFIFNGFSKLIIFSLLLSFGTYFRDKMANWTPEQSSFLSPLLNDVVGTPEMVRIRQDYCRILDEVNSSSTSLRTYLTGSQAEGLHLPGSDEDLMFDVNDHDHIHVVQDIHAMSSMTTGSLLLFTIDKVPIGFATLKLLNTVPHRVPQLLKDAYQEMDGSLYLSSFLYVHNMVSIGNERMNCNLTRQGPSVETQYSEYDKTMPYKDNVMSINCAYWPSTASEWRIRLRRYGWPTSDDISSIVDFGCHLVPIGHPNSPRNMMEWRISFSLAEKFTRLVIQPRTNPMLCDYEINSERVHKREIPGAKSTGKC